MGAGTDISEGLATNRAQFTSHMYSQFRLKKKCEEELRRCRLSPEGHS